MMQTDVKALSAKHILVDTIIIVAALAIVPFISIFFIELKEYINTLKELIVTWYIFPVSILSLYLFWFIDVVTKKNDDKWFKRKRNGERICHALNKEAGSALCGFFVIFSSFILALFCFYLIIKIPLFKNNHNYEAINKEFGPFCSANYWIFGVILFSGSIMSITSSFFIRIFVETLNGYMILPRRLALIKGFSLLILFIVWAVYYLIVNWLELQLRV